MRIELVLNDHNLLGLWKMNIHQVAHAVRPVHFGTLLGDFDIAPVEKWRKEHEQVGNAFTPILVVILLQLSGLHRQGLARFTDQLFRQGNRILITRGEDFEEVIFFQCGLELFGPDAAFGSFLLFEEIERNMTKYS